MTRNAGAGEMNVLTELLAGKRGGKLFRELVDTAPEAMVIANASGIILLVNKQTEQLFGYARDELVGQAIELLVPQRFRAAHVEHRARFAEAPKVRPMGSGLKLFGRRKDGSEFPIEISLSPLETEGGMLISSAIRDQASDLAGGPASKGRNRDALIAVVGLAALFFGGKIFVGAAAELATDWGMSERLVGLHGRGRRHVTARACDHPRGSSPRTF